MTRKFLFKTVGITAALTLAVILLNKKLKDNERHREILAYEIW